MKRIILLAILALTMNANAQNIWIQFDKLMNNGSYKSAYTLAEGVYKKSTVSAERLSAAYHMTMAASNYQEDVHDSAEARYRALLPKLEPLEKALCYAFLGEYDSALLYADVLKATPVEKIRMYCDAEKSVGMTPTAFDVVVWRILNDYTNNKTTIQRRVELQRMLVEFHAADGDDIRIWHENRLLDYLSNVPNRPMTLERFGESIAKFRGTKSPWYTLLYQRAARWCNGKEDFVSALRYCDTAIQLAPESEGGVECANLINEILQKRVAMDGAGLVMAPGVPSLQRVRYRNLDHLWWRIIPYDADYRWGEKTKDKLRSAKALESGVWRAECGKDYKYVDSYVSLPALKTGKYLLLVTPSEDFKTDGFMAYEVNVTDMYLIQNGQEGLLLDRRTGKPIAGQELLLKKVDYRNTQLLERAHTDSNGRYWFTTKEYHYNYKIVIERDGYTLDANYGYAHEPADTTMNLNATICTDRPIYKPGDTVQVAMVAYRCNGLDAQVAENETVELLFNDPNGQEVEKLTLTTDDFGVAHAAVAIPTDRIAGQYLMQVRSVNYNKSLRFEWVRVEEYKQPKFMVSLASELSAEPTAHHGSRSAEFGRPYTIQGLAASYSAVPVSGARVQYTVTREMLHRWWWRYMGYRTNATEVATGELTTAADGSFNIVFTPEPDSSVELSTKPCFLYTVTTTVTDLNGESHEQTYELRVGFQNAFLSLEKGCTMENLKVKHFDLNGNELPGKVEVKIERLRQPQTPLLDSPLLTDGAHHTVSEADFHRAFPLFAYDKNYNNPDCWPVAEEGWHGKSGVYRITLSAEGADTVVDYITHTDVDARKVQSQQLLWAEVDKKKAEVGETVRLRFGSRFKEVDVYYLLRIGDEERDFRRITVSDELKYIDIPVDSAMLGGFQVDLVALREGIKEEFSSQISVPFSHKKLKVEIATFRDKLLPGETETWTIRVCGEECVVDSSRGQVLPTIHYPLSTIILTMYDDALNSYGNSDWAFSPWRIHWSSHLNQYRIRGGTGNWLEEFKHLYYNGQQPSVWRLKDALPYYNRWGLRMYRNAPMAKNSAAARGESMVTEEEEEVVFAVVEDAVPVIEIGTAESGQRLSSDDIVRMPGTSVESIEAAVAGTGYDDGSDGGAQEVQVRTNLNTLAFFAPTLHTDSDGTVTYRFTVPELLTRWNVKGLAVTKDLKIGTLDKTLVTSKPLMVQPNMPRFLRSGDSLSLMTKVILNNEELGIRNVELPVEVFFVLTDAATGDTICHQTQHVSVKDAAQVMFDVEVPQNVYVATYKISVQCSVFSDATQDGGSQLNTEHLTLNTYSDGEQGQVPVVTNRQAVTVSQALYINGAGEKHFSMPEFLAGSESREPRLLGAEVVSNPVWLAVKCMPYLKSYENPSTLYLANQLYVNGLGLEVLEKLDILDNLDKLAGGVSRLKMNEDVKQTLLKATPWVQDAQSEEEQMAAVANYFDRERLDAELKKVSDELAGRQNTDGGWSWMPEGKSSLWVTQNVLKKLKVEGGKWKSETDRALAYIDREQQRYYDRYVKPYLKKGYKWEPTDIDYLYTRSFYGKANTEAYKFYYANALKSYKDYENLYTQTQLALIFHRHGDKKQSLDLLRRLKEKALTNDEMGMYWRDNMSGWWWYQRPIETQALLIQAFAEITPNDTETIGLMQQWLLKQKQTTHWGNERATTEAIRALMPIENSKLKIENSADAVSLSVFGTEMSSEAQGLEGYRSQRWTGAALDSIRALGSCDIIVRKQGNQSSAGGPAGIAWGAVYYQFTDDMDKIPSSEMGITLKRSYTNLSNPNNLSNPKVGDKIKVRIDIQCDRTMEYLELIDGRPSCVEPLSTRAGWRWNEGLGYYITVNNTDTRCYIDRLEKGKYYLEYEVFVTNPGRFLAGPVTMQCMYAPEFRAIAPAQTLVVDE